LLKNAMRTKIMIPGSKLPISRAMPAAVLGREKFSVERARTATEKRAPYNA
jgi:hypothetical protein